MVIHIYDNGLTALIRSGRISPDYQRQGLLIPLFRHVKEWAIENGVETVISTERELKPLQEKRKERRVKSLYFWVRPVLKLLLLAQRLGLPLVFKHGAYFHDVNFLHAKYGQ